eukprot:1232987-Rhodomonas_salina.1
MKEEHDRLESQKHARAKVQGVKAALRMKMMMGGVKLGSGSGSGSKLGSDEDKAKGSPALSDEEAE